MGTRKRDFVAKDIDMSFEIGMVLPEVFWEYEIYAISFFKRIP